MKPHRQTIRLRTYDYNMPGAYFITVCTKNRMPILSRIDVGTVVLDGPQTTLTYYGQIADKHLREMQNFYEHIVIDKYVIMPNHIHLLLRIKPTVNGPSRTTVPTRLSTISRFIGTFKRFCNRDYGRNIWQNRSYDHIIRGEHDYREIWTYIDNNPAKWCEDRFFIQKEGFNLCRDG